MKIYKYNIKTENKKLTSVVTKELQNQIIWHCVHLTRENSVQWVVWHRAGGKVNQTRCFRELGFSNTTVCTHHLASSVKSQQSYFFLFQSLIFLLPFPLSFLFLLPAQEWNGQKGTETEVLTVNLHWNQQPPCLDCNGPRLLQQRLKSGSLLCWGVPAHIKNLFIFT